MFFSATTLPDIVPGSEDIIIHKSSLTSWNLEICQKTKKSEREFNYRSCDKYNDENPVVACEYVYPLVALSVLDGTCLCIRPMRKW